MDHLYVVAHKRNKTSVPLADQLKHSIELWIEISTGTSNDATLLDELWPILLKRVDQG